MPIQVRDDADDEEVERLLNLRKGAEFGRKALDELRARGVNCAVVDGQEIVGVGATPEEAWEEARDSDSDMDRCVLVTVPDEGSTYFL